MKARKTLCAWVADQADDAEEGGVAGQDDDTDAHEAADEGEGEAEDEEKIEEAGGGADVNQDGEDTQDEDERKYVRFCADEDGAGETTASEYCKCFSSHVRLSLAGTSVFIFPRGPRQTVCKCAAKSMAQMWIMPTAGVRLSRFVRVLHVYGYRARHTFPLAAF